MNIIYRSPRHQFFVKNGKSIDTHNPVYPNLDYYDEGDQDGIWKVFTLRPEFKTTDHKTRTTIIHR